MAKRKKLSKAQESYRQSYKDILNALRKLKKESAKRGHELGIEVPPLPDKRKGKPIGKRDVINLGRELKTYQTQEEQIIRQEERQQLRAKIASEVPDADLVRYNELRKEYFGQRTRVQHFVSGIRKRGYEPPLSVDILGPAIPKPDTITGADIQQLQLAIMDIQDITPDTIYSMSTGRDVRDPNVILSGTEAREIEKQKQSLEAKERYILSALPRKFRAAALEKLQKAKEAFFGKRDKEKLDQVREKLIPEEERGEGNGGEATSEVYTVLAEVRELIDTWEPMPFWSAAFANIKQNDLNIVRNMFEGKIREVGEEQLAANLQAKAEEIKQLVEEILYASGSKEHDINTGRSNTNYNLNRLASIINGGPLTPEQARDIQDMQEYNESWEDRMKELAARVTPEDGRVSKE